MRHRIISAIHGAIAASLGVYYAVTKLDLSCGKQNSYFETGMVANTAAFLLTDLIYMLAKGFLDPGNLIHHMLGIVSYSHTFFFTQRDANFLCFHLLPGEATNVQMNVREIFRKIGMRFTKTYFYNEFNYLGMYLVCRMLWIPSIYYFIFNCPSCGIVLSILYPIHCL